MSEENKLKKIVMIGPVYPYKGGISHYTGLMYRALSKKYDIIMVSFKFQYPKILYKKEQRDYTSDSFRIEETEYWINTANPLNWISSAKKIRKLKPDLVIFQWWHPYFAPCYYVMNKVLKELKVLFVCHNVFPHERFPMDKFLAKLILKAGDYFIVQSKKDEADLLGVKPNAVYEIAVHPTYNMFKFENMSMQQARGLLAIDEKQKVLLFFGFIREYKGLKYLINAMQTVVNHLENVKLLIVGDYSNVEDKEKYEKLIFDNKLEDVVKIYDGYIPDKEVEKYFAASDIVVLPYISATQSGIIQIAYGFEKPVIVTDVGGLTEVVKDGVTGYVVEPENSEQLANKIVHFFTYDKEDEIGRNIRSEEGKFSWDEMVDKIEKLAKGALE